MNLTLRIKNLIKSKPPGVYTYDGFLFKKYISGKVRMLNNLNSMINKLKVYDIEKEKCYMFYYKNKSLIRKKYLYDFKL